MTYGAGTGGGSSGRDTDTQHRPQHGRTHGEVLEGNWGVREAPEEEDPGESWSSRVFSSSLTSPTVCGKSVPFPLRGKVIFEGFSVNNADPALHLHSGPFHCGHQSWWGHQPHTKAQPDPSLAPEVFHSLLDLTHTLRPG